MARAPRRAPVQEPLPEPLPSSSETQAFTPNVPLETLAPTYALAFEGRSIPLRDKTIVLGRSRECDLRLADPNISRRHAEVQLEGDGSYALVDLGSTNGTELNGKRVSHARLSEGDAITIGQTELTFVRE